MNESVNQSISQSVLLIVSSRALCTCKPVCIVIYDFCSIGIDKVLEYFPAWGFLRSVIMEFTVTDLLINKNIPTVLRVFFLILHLFQFLDVL